MCSTTHDAMTQLRPPIDALKAELDASRSYIDALSRGERPERQVGISWFELEVVDTDLEGAVLVDAFLQGTRFLRCRLDRALVYDALAGYSVWDGSSLVEAEFNKATLAGASLRDTVLDRARFVKTDLSDAVFTGASARGANFFKAWMPDADLAGVDLQDADLTRANLEGADLSGAKLAGANLTKVFINAGTKLTGCTGLDSVRVDILFVDGEKLEGDAARRALLERAAAPPA